MLSSMASPNACREARFASQPRARTVRLHYASTMMARAFPQAGNHAIRHRHSNVRTRRQSLYGNGCDLSLCSRTPGGVEAASLRIELPLPLEKVSSAYLLYKT